MIPYSILYFIKILFIYLFIIYYFSYFSKHQLFIFLGTRTQKNKNKNKDLVNEQCFPKYKEPQCYFREYVRKPNCLKH